MREFIQSMHVRMQSRLFKLLFLASFFSVMLSGLRILYSDSIQYVFLNWNLVLAAVPWVVSRYMKRERLAGRKMSFVKTWSLRATWLLFFPNAPYIITDLYHLHTGHTSLLWFDALLILSFAWAGLLFGLISLRDLEFELRHSLGRVKTRLIIPGVLFLSAFGIYLGRFQRWNSWDILAEPQGLFIDIFDLVANPMTHPKAWGVTIVMGLFLNMVYWSLGSLKQDPELTD